MQIEINEEQMTSLGKAIARAQITAHDDWADEIVGALPEEYHRSLPPVGAKTGEERLKQARAIEQKARVDEEGRERGRAEVARIVAEREASDAKRLEQFQLEHEAQMAQHRANVARAKANGHPEPSEPPKPPSNADELRHYDMKQRVGNFI